MCGPTAIVVGFSDRNHTLDVILGPVPRICNGLTSATWLDPRDKPEDDFEDVGRPLLRKERSEF